jgi:hypothetical protein
MIKREDNKDIQSLWIGQNRFRPTDLRFKSATETKYPFIAMLDEITLMPWPSRCFLIRLSSNINDKSLFLDWECGSPLSEMLMTFPGGKETCLRLGFWTPGIRRFLFVFPLYIVVYQRPHTRKLSLFAQLQIVATLKRSQRECQIPITSQLLIAFLN